MPIQLRVRFHLEQKVENQTCSCVKELRTARHKHEAEGDDSDEDDRNEVESDSKPTTGGNEEIPSRTVEILMSIELLHELILDSICTNRR